MQYRIIITYMKPTSPCVSLLLSILASVAGFTTASASETYSADGVNLDNILKSSRFYDTDKGLYWEMVGQPYDGAKQLYEQHKSFSFLGDLNERMLQPVPQFKDAFDNLVHDGNSCWYCVGANIIQYWESYYGVFYKGEEPLPYGYTYSTDYLTTLAGTQSLDLHMFFYDNWTQKDRDNNDAGGDAEMAVVWYLSTGKNIREDWDYYSQLVDGAADAGFFSEYFTENAASREAYYVGVDASDLISATDFLREAFGFDRNGNQATYGQLAYVGIMNKRGQGHALTCYGFSTGLDGQLESLYLTNSDDKEYKVFQVYVGLDERGYLHLYEDAAHTKGWGFLDGEWDICDITYINTPAILREMYDEYTNAPLTWTGAQNTWSGTDAAKATTEQLPGKDSGWQVYAMDGYYASYYQAGREVAFNDLAAQKNVNLKGALSTPALHLDNNASDYTFTGATGTSLQADAIIKQGAGRAAFTKTALNAGTVSVGMGTLSLGANAPLTAQSGVVDNLGTLELAASGKATFSKGLTICNSAALAVTGSAQLTSTLTLQEGSALHLTLGSANKTTQLLTLTGNLNVQGACELTVDGTLASGQSYILMNVSGSVTGWSDITTNCGTITLNGKQLKLAYEQPGSLTWTGGSNTWSSAKWDGKDATSAGKDVAFNRSGTTTVTVQGTVSPHSMAFTQGTYTLAAGTGAAISGCRTITLGSGTTVTSQVDLAGADVSLGGNSKLTMSLQAANGTLGGLEMAEGSTLTLGGSTRYTVEKAGALNGTIQLNNTAVLQLQTAMDTELYGAINGNANTQLALTNSSTEDDVTYYMGDAPTGFLGTIAVGTDKDTHRTTLRLDDASHKFTLNKSGELSLRGNGSVTGTVNGSGTLTIERNANYQLAPGGTAAFGADILLNMEGTALIGTEETPITAGLPKKVTVSGNLTTYFKSTSGVKPLELGELTLQDGGSYTLVHTERTLYSSHTIDKLAVDGGGSLTNSIMDVEQESGKTLYKHDLIVNTLSGSGTLDLETSSDIYVTKLTIKDTASGGYDGDIVIYNPHYNKMVYYANYDHGQVVEMQSGTVNGVVRLEAHGMVSDDSEKTQFPLTPYGLAGFGLGGDITVGGLDDTESSKTTYLYSGSYQAAVATKDKSHLFADNIALEKHTLTINAAEDYEFRGQVFPWLSLVKQGSGTQTFSGDTSEFEGGLHVDAGELVFEKAINLAESVTLNGGTLRLHGGSLKGLKGLQGAASGSGGTLALDTAADGKAYDIDLTGASGKYTVQLNDATVTLKGDTDTLTGLGTTLTATGSSSITVASGKKLALQSAITNSGTLTLTGAINASALTLTQNGDTHVDTAGKMGASGFAKKAGASVTIVNGGTTVSNEATVTHEDLQIGTLTLRADGTAGFGGEVDHTTYLLTGTDTASVSAITRAADGKLKSIQVEGGTLTVDAASDLVNATGGLLNVTYAGTLGAALSGTAALTTNANVSINRANTHSGGTTVQGGTLRITDKAAPGTGAVTLSGGTLEIAANGFTNTITAEENSRLTIAGDSTLTLTDAIANTGTLTMKGAFNISALKLSDAEVTHVDTEGRTGASGFTKTGGRSVTVVSGGSTADAGASFTHTGLKSDEVLTLGTDGVATTGDGQVNYTSYLLTGTDTAKVSAIANAAKAHSTTLNGINVEGGKLTVDAATELISATGGKLDITTTGKVGGTARDTAVTASAGTLAIALSGSSAITAKGNVTINQANTHTGNTAVIGGKLHIDNKAALGTGKVTLTDGTLEIADNGFANTVSASGNSAITLAGGSTLALQGAIANTGTLTLSGKFDASKLTLEQGKTTHVDINGKTGASGFEQSGGYSVTIVNGGTTVNNRATITHTGLTGDEKLTLGTDGKATTGVQVNHATYLLTGSDKANVADINKQAGAELTSIDVEGGTLTVDAATDKLHATGGYIEVTRAVNVNGSISGAKVTASAGTISATIGGAANLVVNKGSKVTLSGSNTYTGGTAVYTGGVLRVTNANALGTGEVLLSCGTLEIAANGVANKITTSCSGSVVRVENGFTLALKQAIENTGTVTLEGNINADALTLARDGTTHVDINGKYGDSGFTKSGGASVTIVKGGTVNSSGTTISHKDLAPGETLTLGRNGVATSGGTVDYSTYLLAGTDAASVSAIEKAAKEHSATLNGITVQGGTLTVDTATGKVEATGGGISIEEGGSLTIARNSALANSTVTLKGGALNLAGKNISQTDVVVNDASKIDAGTNGQVKSLTLATAGGADGRNGELLYAEELKLTGNLKTAGLTLTKGNITGGSITATGASTVQQGYIGTGITGTTLTKTGDKRVELGGRNKFTGGVTVQQGALALLEKSGMEANITVNSGASLLTAITVNGDITLLNDAIMRLRPSSTYKLQHNLIFSGGAFHGDLSTDAGGTLSLQKGGTLNGSLTLGGGELVYYGGNSPLTVTGTLTLSKATTLTMTGDLVKGKTYTLFKCNDIVKPTAFDPAAFFANPDVVVNVTSTDITATYNGETVHSSTPSSLVREPEPEETEEAVGEDLPTRNALMATTAPAGTPSMSDGELTKVEAPVMETLAAGVADALVQADWGIVNAQRAFTGTLNGRHQSLRALGTGRTAVWADAIGSHTRQSSAHGHAGADNTLYGAALGVEFNAGAHGAAGVAIGHTWDRVNTFGMNRVKQDTQHAGAFGRARVFSRGANSLWLEAAAGYGKTESRGTLGYSRERWTQNSGTLTVHANDVMYISETTALNYFGGLEYTATDSGSIDNVHTGSVQNLRGEIGAGVTHAIGHGTVFAEAALTGDMVRHNPTAGVDMRRGGANPGRIGASITVGGAYAITDHWSVNATYSFEGAKHNNSHNAGIGATLRF